MSQRRGPAKPPMRGRGPSRPPMQTGQPQQQNYQQQQQRQSGGGRGRGRGRGRGGARQYNSQRRDYNQSGQGGYSGGGYQNNQQQNQNNVAAQQQAAPQMNNNSVNQQQSAPRRGRPPMKAQNNAMFEQFNAQQSSGQSMGQQQAPPQQQQQQQPRQQQQQNTQQQNIPQQTQEEEKAVIEQTSGGPSAQNTSKQQQQSKGSGSPSRKVKPVKTGGVRSNQPPWVEFTGPKDKPRFADWGHRVRQVLSADTLRIARLKPRNARPLDPPEIIQLTLDGITVPRCQRYDGTKTDAERKAEAKKEKKKLKDAQRRERKAKKEAEAKSQEQAEKEDSKGDEKPDNKKGKDKKEKGGGKGKQSPEKSDKSNKQKKDNKDDAKDNKDGDNKKKQQKQNKNKEQEQKQGYQPPEEDQPFAYEAREFVRNEIMNKNVFFAAWRITSSQPQNNNQRPIQRYYGDVYYQDGKNNFKSLTRELVSAGFAELKQGQFGRSDLSEKEKKSLDKKQGEAKKKKLNIWSYDKDTGMNEKRVLDRIRTIKWIQYEEQEKFGQKFRGKTLQGIVDQVISGSTLRVELVIDKKKNIHNNVVVNIAGINAPKVPSQQDNQRKKDFKKMSKQQIENQRLSERFGVVAREWTEERLLGQIVKVKILRVSNKQIIAQIIHEKGRIGPSLLKKGLAFYEGWSAVLTDKQEQEQLSQAVKMAQNSNQQIWNFVNRKSRGAPKNERRLTVIQVISGDTIACLDEKGKEIRFTLSSIRAPKLGVRLPAGTLARQAEEMKRQQQNQGQFNNNNNNNNRQSKQQRGGQQQQQQPQSPDKSGDNKKKTKRGGRKRTGGGGGGGSGPSSPSKKGQEWEYKPDEYLAREAKEFVRKRCIGKQVRIIEEYTRKAPTFRSSKEQEKNFATVFYSVNDKGKESNLALDLIKQGLVDLVIHGKSETNRSLYYAELEDAWNQARQKKTGLYEYLVVDRQKGNFIKPDDKKREIKALETAIGDYSGVNEKIVKTHELIRLNQYLKNNKVRGIIEFIFGANRVKVYIPQRKVCIAVRLSDIRVGDYSIDDRNNIDPFRKEAKEYLNKTILQREIELEITSTGQETGLQQRGRGGRGRQKGGQGGGKGGTQATRNPNYDGHIHINGRNISEDLLEKGLATVIMRRYNDTMYDRQKPPPTFRAIEKRAQENKVGLWENYDEQTGNYEAKNDEQKKQRIASSKTGKEVEVVVSHIESASLFYVNDANSDAMQKMNADMEKLQKSRPKPPKTIRPGKGVKYAAEYDGYYARARVNNRAKERTQQGQNDNKGGGKKQQQNDSQSSSASSEWYVKFIDYGNTARISRQKFAELPAELRIDKIPPLAMRCELAGINVYKKNERAFNDAGYFFSTYAFQSQNQRLKMKILYDDQYYKTWYVELFVGDKSLNQLIAREGFVTLIKPRDLPQAFSSNKEHGEDWSDEHKLYVKQYFDAIKANISLAKDEHKNIWYHGDVESADEDNFPDQTTNKKGAKSRR